MRPADDGQGIGDIGFLAEKFRHGGFTATVIAMSGMVAKILLEQEPVSLGRALRFVASAGIVGFFVGLGLEEVAMANGLKMACLGISGAAASEIVEYAVKWVRAKGQDQVNKANPKGGSRRGRRKAR